MPDIVKETLLTPSNLLLFGRVVEDLAVVHDADIHIPFIVARKGSTRLLHDQLESDKADAAKSSRFARIYGFSFEGTYYDLPRPALFLVHGPGEMAETVTGRAARAPDNPSRTGLGAADFSFADGMKVWSYDKADYTIRMDVETGMFEQVLLEAHFADGQPVSGMRVSGMHVSGMHVSGMRVAGMRVSGMRVGGARGRGDAGD